MVRRSRHHHCQRALLGAGDAAGDRTVELHDVALGEQIVNPHRHLRACRGEIEYALDLAAFDHAVLAGRNIERDLQRRQAHHDRLDPVGDVFRR